MNLQIFFFCPVPENQKPLTEFILFQENTFYHWIFSSKKKEKKKIFLFSFFLCFLHFFFIFPVFVFFIFFRWSIIEKKFNNSRLFYEEGSWYDGQIWEKPLNLIKYERLISSQILQPILKKLSLFLIFLVFFNLFLYSF
jgi:hypothetical protein